MYKIFFNAILIFVLTGCQNNTTQNDNRRVQLSTTNNLEYKSSETGHKTNNSITRHEIDKLYPENQFAYYNFDVNGDAIKDLVVTYKSDKNGVTQGSDLYVYLGQHDDAYILDLEFTNFTFDGVISLGSIMPRINNKGFIIHDYFTSTVGHNYFYLTYNQGKWKITKYILEANSSMDHKFYCVEEHNADAKDLNEFSYGKVMDYSDIEKLQNCPMPSNKYEVIVNKAEILDESFQSRNPPNYFIKSDIVIAEHQNEDWIYVRYKNNSKVGWISKAELKAIH